MVSQVLQGQERCALAFSLHAKEGADRDRPPLLKLEPASMQQAPELSPKPSFWATFKKRLHQRWKSIIIPAPPPASPVHITLTPIGRNALDATKQVI